jgi:SAM-dependent methyltransferase
MDDFYSAFESRFRGSRELVLRRLGAYEPFLQPLASVTPEEVRAVDLGCGRGEWLELLRNRRFNAVGVDLDESMLADCQRLGLDVVQREALDYLLTLQDESVNLVSAFHVVEHISFDHLRRLVAEAFRVLRPGGLLILETPNAENLTVGTSSFYLDPTHHQPVHPLTMAFLADYSGFSRSKVLRLNGERLPSIDAIGLADVLSGVSPDCSVVAQKSAADSVLREFDEAFGAEWGVSLQQTTAAYDAGIQSKFQSGRSDLLRLRGEVDSSMAKSLQDIAGLREEIIQMRTDLTSTRTELSATHSTLLALQNTRSWRWTAPLRRLHADLRANGGKVLRRAMPLARSIAHQTPWTRKAVRTVLTSSPSLARLVQRFLKQPEPTAPSQPAHTAPAITRFEHLRSVKLMSAVRGLREEGTSIVYIGKDEHGT